MKTKGLISVIIVSKNEENHIGVCIKSVLETAYEPKEIIVVDDSSDRTPEIVKKFKDVRLIRATGSLGAARNIGWRAAKGQYICFVDADILLPRDYFERMMPYFKGNVGIVGCRNKALRKGFFSSSDDLALHLSKIQWGCFKGGINTVPCGGTIYLRKAIEDAGGFDDVRFGEDSSICIKAKGKGYDIVYPLDVFNYHDFTPKFKQWSLQCMKGGSESAHKSYLIALVISPIRGIFFMVQGLIFTDERKTSLYLPFYYPLKWIFICWGTIKEKLGKKIEWEHREST